MSVIFRAHLWWRLVLFCFFLVAQNGLIRYISVSVYIALLEEAPPTSFLANLASCTDTSGMSVVWVATSFATFDSACHLCTALSTAGLKKLWEALATYHSTTARITTITLVSGIDSIFRLLSPNSRMTASFARTVTLAMWSCTVSFSKADERDRMSRSPRWGMLPARDYRRGDQRYLLPPFLGSGPATFSKEASNGWGKTNRSPTGTAVFDAAETQRVAQAAFRASDYGSVFLAFASSGINYPNIC